MKEFKNYISKTLVEQLNIKELNNLQKEVIPIISKDKNVVLISETGTGKTLCYLIPILENINLEITDLQCIIVVPTKELIRQITKILMEFKKSENNLSYLSIINNASKINFELEAKSPKHQILVCSPNKFNEISKFKNYTKSLKFLVLDEADMTLDLGFFGLVNQAFSNIKNIAEIKKIATSATLHESLSIQISKFFKNSVIINHSKNIWSNKNIKHFVIHYNQSEDKKKMLVNIVKILNPYFGIIFCNTKKEVDQIYDYLYDNKFRVLKLHGNLDNRERKNIFREIKENNFNLLVASDLASRGVDIEGASHIISYDLPKEDLWYIHRAGRSGRKFYKGNSYVFNDKNSIYQIQRLDRKGIEWNHLKFDKKNLVDYEYKLKPKPKKETEVDRKIRDVINKSSKKVKPNYKKKIKIQIKEIKRQAKRQRIEELVNEQRLKKYKIESARKTKLKKERGY
ncbi:MAG: DEAD/DEAH box helicase [Malacoplasma sp.]|nr:DEAD/DEAH box helicase [Malacoplasma sp.]